jgi:hypothetical protein
MTKEDRSFNAFLIIVFVITVIVLISIFLAQSAVG